MKRSISNWVNRKVAGKNKVLEFSNERKAIAKKKRLKSVAANESKRGRAVS